MAGTSREPEAAAVRRAPYIPTRVIVAVVVLRLLVGWHFYREGTKKLDYDPHTGSFEVTFSAEPFLRQAVGPVAEMVKDYLPNAYNWERYLAVPRQVRPSTVEELEQRQKWEAEYAAKRREAEEKDEPAPFEFPPHSPYYDWATRIVESWQSTLQQFQGIDGLKDEQKKQADEKLQARRQQLADYLESQTEAIAEWEHELWRLEQMKSQGGGDDPPFLASRISEKQAETTATGNEWIAQVLGIEQAYRNDLRQLLTKDQAENSSIVAQVDAALQSANDRKLHFMNVAVTIVVTGVGVLLMVGLFSRLASAVGILFLLSVMATQPPWVPGANNPVFYYQLVEIGALAVLFAAAAGRWAGLDFLIHALLGGRKES